MLSMVIGDYLIQQLAKRGVRHVFGVAGDYVLGLMRKLSQSNLQLVNTCDEQGAGMAADAYARITGLGAVCVTYGVGGLKVVNTTAQAYAEQSPVVVISGAPGMPERQRNPYMHHKAKAYDTQVRVFEELTVASAVLDDPQRALQRIDEVLDAVQHYKRPGYIELPRDMVSVVGAPPPPSPPRREPDDPAALQEALAEAASMINAARQPVILAGVEVQRFGLQGILSEFSQRSGIPVAATILSKSAIAESDPLYMGVYAGALGNEALRDYVESSDCLILLGLWFTDMDLGVYTAHIDQSRAIHATSERVTIRHHHYQHVGVRDLLVGLIAQTLQRSAPVGLPCPQCAVGFSPLPNTRITVERFFQCINTVLDHNTMVVADVGDALFGAMDLVTCQRDQFQASGYYTSLGFAVPGSIGAQMANPALRPLVLVGDGAFQMTGMELSTIVRYALNPVVVVLNNGGYATERPMQDGPFNDVLPWHYSRLPEVLGAGRGFVVETEEDLQRAIDAAQADTTQFAILDVRLAPGDISPALQRLARGLAKGI